MDTLIRNIVFPQQYFVVLFAQGLTVCFYDLTLREGCHQ